MRVLERMAPGSSVVFDYSQPREVLPAVEQQMLDSISARVAKAGEPFQLFFTPGQLAEEMGTLQPAGAWLKTWMEGGWNAAVSCRETKRWAAVLRGSAGRICHARVGL